MRDHTHADRPFAAVFDYDGDAPEIRPGRPFPIEPRPDNEELVARELLARTGQLFREPQGALRHPYIVPGGNYDQLWDWDGFFCGLAVADDRPEHFRGSALNFLEHLDGDGRMPNLITVDGPSYRSVPQPLLAQWCAIACRVQGDAEWLRPSWDNLVACRRWFERTGRARRGLFRLPEWPGIGLDNDPVTYGAPPDTVGAVHLNCQHYRECLAMARLAERLGRPVAEAAGWRQQADVIADAIRTYMWDPIDGLFYHLDLADRHDLRRQAYTWELPYKVRTWAALFPLWAGIATDEQAARVVREHVLNEVEFLSPVGIRSLAANERIYNNAPSGNPSNWQGPVWGASTFLTAYALARYGFRDEALMVARRLVDAFAADLRTNGALHEYYHADTGVPVLKPGFLSWNLLAVRVLDDIRRGVDPAEIA